MLPPSKFPRFALAAALFAAVLLVLDLSLVRSPVTSLLLSNALDFTVVLLASLACFSVARRSSGYHRQLWALLTVAFVLESLAQAISSYYQSFVPGSAHTPWPSDILFFVWTAPAFMLFLPRSGDGSDRIDSLRVLDFLQVAIVAITLYLVFFYSSSRWLANPPALLRQILILYIFRDLLLSAGFFFRSRSFLSPPLRSFFFVLAFVFLAAVLSDAEYLFTLGTSLGASSWGDLLWMVPYFIVLVLALNWRQPDAAPLPAPSTHVGDLVLTQIFPISIPLLVLFLGAVFAQRHFLLAWLALAASVLCSSVRLILSSRRQRRVAEELLQSEQALRRSEQLLSTAFRNSPDAFSINLFPNGPYLEINDGFTRLTGYSRQETLGKTPSQINLWVDATAREKVLARLNTSGEVRGEEFQFRNRAGKLCVGQMNASLLDIEGQRCSLVVVRDITARKEAEELLRTSEQRFRSLVENLHVGIISYDPQGRILFANQASLALLGFSLDQVIGKTVEEIGIVALNDDGTAIENSLRPISLVLHSRKPVRSQIIGWRIPNHPDILWGLLDAVPEFSPNGQLLRIIVSITDLSQQRRATEALRESEERFRTLVNNLHVAVVLHRPDGRVEYVNPAMLRMFGLPQDTSFVGKFPPDLGIINVAEDGRELSIEERPVSVVLRTRAPLRDVLVGLRHPSSPETVWVFGSCIPHLDEHGNLVRVITSFSDVTAQRRAAAALRESEELFRTLVRDLHVAVVLHHIDGRVEFANPAAYRMFDIPEGTAVGKLPSDYGVLPVTEDGKDIPPADHPIATVVRTGTPVENGVLGLRYPGSPDRIVWVYGNVVPQFDATGKVVRVISSFSDITEMKNAERAIHNLSTHLLTLQDEERRRIGRELHDGLAQTVLAINLSLAQARQSIDPHDRSAVSAIEKARGLTQQMSREIRTLSYLLHPPLLDDLGLISALKEYAQGFSERSGIDTQVLVFTQFDRLPQPVETALFRVVQESLANIQRHSGSSTAAIRLHQYDNLVALEVIDFGHGMPIPRNGSPQPDHHRLGVGIPGMRERLALLGGHLEILSNPRGTTIRATLPITSPAISPSAST